MPITRSAKKALRQSLRRHAQRAKRKDAVKRAVKGYKKLIAAKDVESAKEKLREVYKALDKAVKTNIFKRNTASRLKSRLTQLIAKSSSASS